MKILNSSSLPEYPDNFILQNGRKALLHELKLLPKNCRRRSEIKGIISKNDLKVIKVMEQDIFILPGNGFSLTISKGIKGMGSSSLYGVLDGTIAIADHLLPNNTGIILASSPLGRALIKRRVGEEGVFNNEDGEVVNFVIKKIIPPSKSKWVFRFPNPLKNKYA